ncbi:NTCP2-like protein, partial [Mya arenaria]
VLKVRQVKDFFTETDPRKIDENGEATVCENVRPVKVNAPEGNTLLAFFMDKSSHLQSKIEVMMDTDFTATFDFVVVCVKPDVTLIIDVTAEGLESIKLTGATQFSISCSNVTGQELFDPLMLQRQKSPDPILQRNVFVAERQIDVKLISGLIGFGKLRFQIYKVSNGSMDEIFDFDHHQNATNMDQENRTLILSEDNTYESLMYDITVVRKVRPVDRIFRVCIYCVQIFVATGFGAKLNLDVVKKNVMKPVAVSIGLASQYIVMPLIAFTVAKSVRIDETVIALGIFVAGCCPGGGASNMYSYLLHGDLDLSITMTALSTVLALGMLPLWLYTLGSVFLTGSDLQIPFEMVAVSLSILITPLLFGIFLRQKFPRVADNLQKALKPVIIIMSLILLVVGIYSNLYIFRMFKPNILLAGLLLPYVGYLCGAIFALICRQPWTRIKTIAIETGMQNTNIAYILLTTSFEAPLGDIAAVAPVASAVMTPLPLFLITIFYLLYQRFCKKQDETKDPVEGNVEDEAAEKLTAHLTEKPVETENGLDKASPV